METGFKTLDEIITLDNNKLIVVGGRPAMGKTTFALSIIKNIALKQNIPSLYFSLETSEDTIIDKVTDKLYISFKSKYSYSKEQIIDKILAIQSKVDIQKIERTKMNSYGIKVIRDLLTDEEQELLNVYLTQINNSRLYVDDTANITFDYIEEQCRKLKQKQNIKFVVIDYLQLINYDGDIKALGTKLKALAEELNVTILVLSQVSKELEQRENKRPSFEDLKQSKPIAEVADIVMFMYRENYYNTDTTNTTTEVIISKNENENTDIIKLEI